MAEIGDKFIIEIGAVQKHYGLNFIKGLNYLVISDEDLDKLEKYESGKELKDEIKVGDEVAITDGRKFVATYVSKTDNYVAGLDPSGNIVGTPLGSCVRTGRTSNFLADAVRSLKE